jgi:hypothetical protein
MKCLGCCLGENLEEEKLVRRIFQHKSGISESFSTYQKNKVYFKGDQISKPQKKNEPTCYASHVFWDDLKINKKTEKSFIG